MRIDVTPHTPGSGPYTEAETTDVATTGALEPTDTYPKTHQRWTTPRWKTTG
ncbi:MAG TPA: hypothetical protein VFC82_07760 [Actinomycetaceae bacterium]|nr:hypothetical protein [Actinomycetaceae bacterium]